MKRSTISGKSCIVKIAVPVLWLMLWQGAYLAVGEDLLLVSPFAAFSRMMELSMQSSFWQIVVGSLGRIVVGFLLGLMIGTLLAGLTARSQLLYSFFSLPMSMIKATPVASFVILAFVWISGENISVFIAFLMVLPLVWSNVDEGLRSVDSKLLELAQVYRIPQLHILKSITIPAVLPYFLSAAKVGLGFSWKAGIAGEVIAIPSAAIGTQLYNAKVYLETVDLFAWTAVIILLSVLLERLMVRIFSHIVRRLNRLTEEGAGCL